MAFKIKTLKQAVIQQFNVIVILSFSNLGSFVIGYLCLFGQTIERNKKRTEIGSL
jgi:hypothetical protein